MQDNTSPEERLLHLIRGDRKKSSREQEQVTKKIETPQSQKVTQEKNKSLPTFVPTFSFNLINRILLVFLLILGIYLVADFLIISRDKIEKRISALGEVKDTTLKIQTETSPSPKPLSYYTESVKSRNLFTAPGPKTKQLSATPSFLDMVSKLRLQGIISSGSNPQAIIEDTKTRQVYFLSPGESIGEIELKAILQGKVRLDYYGQEAELSL